MTADRVSVKVRRMDIPRFRAFQVAAFAGIALSLFGRRVPGLPLSVLVGVFSIVVVIALVLGLRSYQWLGRREIVFEKDHLLLGEGGPAVHRRDLRMWALGEGEVRLYAADSAFVWKFLAGDDQLEVFRAKLTTMFGRPRILVRRGSRRRRAMGVGLAFAGAGAFAVGLGAELNALGLVGVLVAAFAFTSFMFSSQKVQRPEP
jgi:membrane protein implicated in regulation of membrane protease activity